VATVLWRNVKSVTAVLTWTSLATVVNVAKAALELGKNLETASFCQGKLAG